MISYNEEETEYYPGYTLYKLKITYQKQTEEYHVKRESTRQGDVFTVVEPEEAHPVLKSIACRFIKSEYAKMHVLGDY